METKEQIRIRIKTDMMHHLSDEERVVPYSSSQAVQIQQLNVRHFLLEVVHHISG